MLLLRRRSRMILRLSGEIRRDPVVFSLEVDCSDMIPMDDVDGSCFNVARNGRM